MISGATVFQNIRRKQLVDQTILHVVLLVLTLLAGAALRFYNLGAEDFWFDELIMFQEVQKPIKPFPDILVGRPPVYPLLAHFWFQTFGPSEAATRSLSALAGTLSLIVIYAVGRTLFDRRIALTATLLMAFSEFQIYYSQEFRYYSVFLLFTLLSFLCYIRFLKHASYSTLALYVLSSLLMFFSHTSGVFILLVQGLFFLLQARRLRGMWITWVVSQVLIALAIAPQVLITSTASVSGEAAIQTWIPDRPWWYMLETLQKFMLSERFYLTPKRLAVSMAWLALGTGLFILWKGRANWLAAVRSLVPTAWRELLDHKNHLLLVALWLICPIGLIFVLSKLFEPIYVHRYLIGSAPAFYLLLAFGLVNLRHVVPLPVLFGFFVIMNGLGLYDYYRYDDKEQWRDLAAYVDAQVQPGDVIVFAPDEVTWLQTFFFMYSQGNLPGCSLTSPQQDAATITRDLAACTAGHDRFWLLLRGGQKRTGQLKAFFLEREHADMQLITEREFEGGLVLYLFTLQK